MKAVILPNYNPNLIRALLGMKVETKLMPVPAKGEVVIKIHASPCNPSDIAFLTGGYNIKKSLPAIPGFEGVGTIEFVGEGVPKELIDKRVSCFIQNDRSGTWSEYVISTPDECIFLKNEMPEEQAACFAVNPFTAYALFNLAKEGGCKTIIQNAATGQVGKFIRILAKRDGIKLINIVRKPEHVDQLKFEGELEVLNSADKNFEEELGLKARELNADICFDAVGGTQSGQILNAMLANSELIVYGGLSGLDLSNIDTLGIIFDHKKLSGFNLMDWMNALEEGEFEDISEYLQDLFINGTLKTDIQSTFKLEDIVKGIRAYIGNMSAGKILIKP
jgi:NADPH:quinone reductase